MDALRIERCTPADFLEIVRDVEDFWGAGRSPRLLHPMFVHEFGDTALVIRRQEQVAAHLFGFIATASPTAYVHLVAVRTAWRREGLAHALYDHFLAVGRARGCTHAKAITNAENAASIAFHQRLGFRLEGDDRVHGLKVVRNYSGPGVDRVVMVRRLDA